MMPQIMKEDHSGYTSKDLLEDDYFISSMVEPTKESEEFWNSLVDDGIIAFDEFERAKHFMQIMQKPKKVMTVKERTDLWVKIEIQNKNILRQKLKRRRMYLYGTAASLFIALFSIGYFLFQSDSQTIVDFQHVMAELSTPNEDAKDIQLILSDNKKIELEDKTADIVLQEDGDILVNSKKIEEKTDTPVEETAVSYNQLIVPLGRHSSLTLSDGTKMHINSGSKVVFPHKFKKKEREIFVDGEVYLEVAHDKQAPFFVRTNNMDIRVLGTSFNVSAYEKENKQAIVLVSGAVSVKTKDKYEAQLSPNQMLNCMDGEYAITAVDVNEYICWKDGYFIYKREEIRNIVKQLSRYYGVNIVSDPEAASIKCSGKLDLKEDLEKVLADLSDILEVELLYDGNTYQIKKN